MSLPRNILVQLLYTKLHFCDSRHENKDKQIRLPSKPWLMSANVCCTTLFYALRSVPDELSAWMMMEKKGILSDVYRNITSFSLLIGSEALMTNKSPTAAGKILVSFMNTNFILYNSKYCFNETASIVLPFSTHQRPYGE